MIIFITVQATTKSMAIELFSLTKCVNENCMAVFQSWTYRKGHTRTGFPSILDSLQEAVNKLLQHASMPMNNQSSSFLMYFITNCSVLRGIYLQIVRQSRFTSRAFRKQLTSCCSTLQCPRTYVPHL